jgi:glycosyltransferase involved in cell wall biosynthesis
MPKLTVLITCKDEELHIRDCIESARDVADEILVADSGSRDATLDIVRSLGGCRIVEREFISYADFKNWSVPQCAHEWVLIIDADERVTPELTREIKALLQQDPAEDAYWIRRENYFLGHRIRFSGWSNDRVVRLIRRDACQYFPRPVHEAMNVPSGKISVLRNAFRHFTAWDLEHFVAKQNNYSTRGAVHMRMSGKHVGLAFTLLHAPFRFLQLYLLRGGFLDGYPGLMVCGITAFYTFLKDIKLWGLEHTINPPPGLKLPQMGVVPPPVPKRKAA